MGQMLNDGSQTNNRQKSNKHRTKVRSTLDKTMMNVEWNDDECPIEWQGTSNEAAINVKRNRKGT
jgi:hypothetical protein